MARFFVDVLPAEGTEYEITGENAAHARVLRLNPGEEVTLCDGAGRDCPCRVLGGLTLLAMQTVPAETEPRVQVPVYLAFPKADKAEHVIQKATELGAAEIVFFPTRFCVSRPEEKSLGKKLERWQRIARAAAEQSRRGRIPRVRALTSYEGALREAAAAELPILFYENEQARTLKATLEGFFGSGNHRTTAPAEGLEDGTGNPSPTEEPETVFGKNKGPASEQPAGSNADAAPRIALMTGAEGGFAPEEIARAEAAGMRICTLGKRILRCETAPLAALSALMYAAGEM